MHTVDTADVFFQIMGVRCNGHRLYMKSVNKTVIACVALCRVTAIKGWSFFSSFMLTGTPYMLGSAVELFGRQNKHSSNCSIVEVTR